MDSRSTGPFLALALGLIPLFATACSDTSGSPSAPPASAVADPLPDDYARELHRDDEVVAEIAWKPTTTVVPDAVTRSTLTNPFAEDGVFELTGAPPEITALAPDSIVVLTGVGVFKVLGVETAEGMTRLRTEPAPLEDAVTSAHITWDVATPEWKAVESVNDGAGIATASLVAPALSPLSDWSAKIDDFDTTFKLNDLKNHADKYDFGASAKLTGTGTQLGSSPDAKKAASLIATGWWARFRFVGGFDVNPITKHTSFHAGIKDATGEVTLNLGSARWGGAQTFDFPYLLTIPIEAGPIPLYFAVGGSAEIRSSIASEAAILGSATIAFRGDGDVTVDESGVHPRGKIALHKPVWKSGEHTTTITSGVGMSMDFPKVSFGVGLPYLQDLATPAMRKALDAMWSGSKLGKPVAVPHASVASVYLKVTSELVYNVDVTYEAAGNFPVVTGTCATVDMNSGVFAGFDSNLFQKKISKSKAIADLISTLKDKQLAGAIGEPHKFGNKCPK